MDIVRQRLHIGEAFVAQQRAEPPAALSLPAVIDIDEVPAVGGESAFNQSVGDGTDPRIADALRETVPAVPPHRRRELNILSDDQVDPTRSGAGGIFSFEKYRIDTGDGDFAGKGSGAGIECRTLRWIDTVQTDFPPLHRERQEKTVAGTGTENRRSMKAWWPH